MPPPEIRGSDLQNAPLAVRAAKEAIIRGLSMPLKKDAFGAGHSVLSSPSEDPSKAQGLREKRKPVWKPIDSASSV